MAQAAEVDDFDAAFSDAATTAEKEVQEGVVAPPAEKPEPKAEEKKETPEPSGGTPPIEKTEEPPAELTDEQKAAKEAEEKAAAEAAAKEAAEQAAEEQRIKAEAFARVEAENQIKAQQEEAARRKKDAEDKAAAEKAEAEKHTAAYVQTEEEKVLEAKFKENFPDEYAATQMMLRRMRQELTAEVYKGQQSVVQQINRDVTPLKENLEKADALAHANAIRAAHSDFDTVIAKFPEWIKQQPAHLQPGLALVYDQGTTEQVISLVADMKKTVVPPSSSGAPPAKPAPTAAELAALAPVTSGRATPSPRGAPDKDDFDGAFAEAAAAK